MGEMFRLEPVSMEIMKMDQGGVYEKLMLIEPSWILMEFDIWESEEDLKDNVKDYIRL